MLIVNGRVYLEGGPEEVDVLIRDGVIEAIGDFKDRPEEEAVFDASGLSVLPGMIDFHVHLNDRIGGFELADDFLSGSEAAVKTGITTLIGFAIQLEGRTMLETLAEYLARASRGSFCDFTFHCTPTRFRDEDWSDIYDLAERGYRTLKLYTTYREAGLYTDYGLMSDILKRCAETDIRVLVHCEDQETLDCVSWTDDDLKDPSFHARMRPEAAEVEAIRRVAALAEESGAAVHIVHVSTAEGLDIIRRGRRRSRLTCETAPHYLFLDDRRLAAADGHRYLCTPPLRNEENRARMERAAAAGEFDLFATDHCAFTRHDKDRFGDDLRTVPKGLAGTGALVPLSFELLVKRPGRDLSELALYLAKNPAKVAGLYPRKGIIRPGSDADLVVLDPNGPERPIISSVAEAYETYPETTATLDIRLVLLRGEAVVRENELVSPQQPRGESTWTP